MKILLFVLLILVILCIGIIFLQIFLSKKKNKWFGLILPLIAFCFSLIAVTIVVANIATNIQIESISEDGEVIQEVNEPITDSGSIIGTAVFAFLIFNSPTAVLLTIYLACREKQKRNLALEKMSVQDLE